MNKQVKVGKNMFDVISSGDNNTVIKWQEGTVAKLFKLGNKQADKELKLLQFANKINRLLVTGLSVTFSSCYKYELLVMERLEILDKRSLSNSERKEYLSSFKSQLQELHLAGFSHGDIKRPLTFKKGSLWDNVCVTPTGLRLIDVGCSSLNSSSAQIQEDLRDLNEFEVHFLS